jgi:hypothetical protein
MPFCKIDSVGNILSIFNNSDADHTVELTPQDMEQIVSTKGMHSAFLIIDGVLTPKPEPTAEEILQAKREQAVLTPMQFMLNVDAAGFMPTIEAYLALQTTPNSFKIMWNKASSFERLYPDLINAATDLGLTDDQLDALFNIT